MDPLVRLKDSHSKGIIPDDVFDLTVKRFSLAIEGINRIEKASGIGYPIAYVEPSLIISSPNPAAGAVDGIQTHGFAPAGRPGRTAQGGSLALLSAG